MKRRILMTIATVVCLNACSKAGPDTAAAPAPPPAGSAADLGARIYNGNCVPCHQENGRGIQNVYPSLAGSPVVLGDPADLARWVILSQRPAAMPAGRYPSAMPPFGWMKDTDAAAVLNFLRSSFGNAAPPVDAARVAQALGR